MDKAGLAAGIVGVSAVSWAVLGFPTPSFEPKQEDSRGVYDPNSGEERYPGETEYVLDYGEDYDCPDFAYQSDAQEVFDANDPDLDPYNLDANGDGEACESLP